LNAPHLSIQKGSTPLSDLAVRNADVLRAINTPPGPESVAALARDVGRDKDNLRKTLKAMAAEGLVTFFDGVPVPLIAEAGVAALRALARAEGQGGAAGGLEVPHSQLRPNPLNPRKTFDPAAIEDLADSIHSAGKILQNLVVGPADASGARILFVGERRWRAVGRLIERGDWPADRGLPCVEQGASAELGEGLAAFLAVVENGQRVDLDPLEEARGFVSLIDATGWSAAHAAKQTGKNPRVVQEGVKVVREAKAEDLALYVDHQGQAPYTWEWLRHSVRQPEPELDPADPLVVNGVRFPNLTRAIEARRIAEGLGGASTPHHCSDADPAKAEIATAPRDDFSRQVAEVAADADREARAAEQREAEKALADRRAKAVDDLEAEVAALGPDARAARFAEVLVLLNGPAPWTRGLGYYDLAQAENGSIIGVDSPLARRMAILAVNIAAGADLAQLYAALPDPPPPPIPAVPIKKSVTPDHLICLEDGRKFKSLKRHLRTQYNLSPDEYRAKWGLPRDYPMLAPNYAAARYHLAREMGLDPDPLTDDQVEDLIEAQTQPEPDDAEDSPALEAELADAGEA